MVRRWTLEEDNALVNFVEANTGQERALNQNSAWWFALKAKLSAVRSADDSELTINQVRSKMKRKAEEFGLNDTSVGHTVFNGFSDRDDGSCLGSKKREMRSLEQLPGRSTSIAETDPDVPHCDHGSTTKESFSTERVRKNANIAIGNHLPKATDGPAEGQQVQVSDDNSSTASNFHVLAGSVFKSNPAKQRRKKRLKTKGATKQYFTSERRLARSQSVPPLTIEHTNRQSVLHAPQSGSSRPRNSSESRRSLPDLLSTHHRTRYADKQKSTLTWQDMMLEAWQSYTASQPLVNVRHFEPVEHRDVVFTLQEICDRISDAAYTTCSIFRHPCKLDSGGPTTLTLANVATGCTTQSRSIGMFDIARSNLPLSDKGSLISVLLGTTIYRWVFCDFRLDQFGSTTHASGSIRLVLDEFLQEECPKMWTDFQDLHRLATFCGITDNIIQERASTFTDRFYNLLLAMHTTELADGRYEPSPLLFAEREVQYNYFRDVITQAYQMALELRLSFARCSDLIYDFRFPVMQELFDSRYMIIKGLNTEMSITSVGQQPQRIAACLLPSIWSMDRDRVDGGIETLVAKAIVLL